MRNIFHSSTSSSDGLGKAGKNLPRELTDKDTGIKISNPRYEAFSHYKTHLEAAYQEYDKHTNPCELEKLNPLIPSDPADTESMLNTKKYYRDGLSELYGRERAFIKDLWLEVAVRNGKHIVCPYCGNKIVEDLDHYIPRAEMPEYSVHLLNLIPLCHKCNKDKHDGWLDSQGRRVFFNAYFDTMPDIKTFLFVNIDFSVAIPKSTLFFDSTAATASGEAGRLAANTIDKLHLVELYWQPKTEEVLRDEIRQILAHCKQDLRRHPTLSIPDLWMNERQCITDIQADLEAFEFVKYAVYLSLIQSSDIEGWLSLRLKSTKYL